MLENLLISLYDISVILLPILGVVVLIVLAVLLIRIIKVVNQVPITISKVNDTIDITQQSIQKLEAPLNTIAGVSNTVDVINKSATGIMGSVASFTMKNSDSIVNWAKGFFGKSDEVKEEDIELTKEEDFGIYE